MLKQNVFRTINQSAVQLLLPLSLAETYKTIVNEAIKILDAKYASIFLKNSRRLEKVYSSSAELAKLKPRMRGNIYRASLRKTPIILSATQLVDPQPIIAKLGIKSVVFIPLYYQKNQLVS